MGTHRAHRTASRHGCGRGAVRAAAAFAWTAGLLLLAALPSACAAQAGAGGAGPSVPDAGTAGSAAATHTAAPGSDWKHVLQVVANLRADPPAEPLVVLLGGSAARESTIGDASWTAQIAADGGPSVAAYNLGSRNRTLAQDLALVKALPARATLVFIGINVGRFTSPPSHPTLKLPAPTATLPPYDQHQYSQAKILSPAKKTALVSGWLAGRYPLFRANYASSVKSLDTLVATCKRRGLRPVLLELPRDTQVIGHALDAPVARFTASCEALARKYDVPWVSFVDQAGLTNTDFYDLWHLVEPGRNVWQPLLSAETAKLLKQYRMDKGAP